jgi:hypothetical protein
MKTACSIEIESTGILRREDSATPVVCPARDISAPQIAFPKDKRPMGRRRAVPIAFGASTLLRWPASELPPPPVTLRLVAAVDHRVCHHLRVADARTGDCFGSIDILFACSGEVFEIQLPATVSESAFEHGLALNLEQDVEPLWIVVPGGAMTTDAVVPHLIHDEGSCDQTVFLARFFSAASLQPCDWMGNCVLDGLRAWAALGQAHAARALDDQLAAYFDPVTGQRDDFRGRPADDTPGGPEQSGPWATLARSGQADRYPAAMALGSRGFDHFYNPQMDYIGHNIVAETSYNIAYPLAAMASTMKRQEFLPRALHQLEINRKYLSEDDALWLRYLPRTGERVFKNWSRGVAWYFLGLVRTLELVPEAGRPSELSGEVARMAAWVSRYQQADGLWPCFLHEPEILPDTSGSAGIAAAIAIAVEHGILDGTHLPVARRALAGLMRHLTSDGWLRGIAPANKKESVQMDIQRLPYRVIGPWGMGLLAQLMASLESQKR